MSGSREKRNPIYQVRRVHIGKTAQLDELAHECGQLYSQTLVFFWRTVRKKGTWLGPKHLMRLFTSKKLHAHTSDATVQAFFASLDSWRERRKTDPTAHPLRHGRGFARRKLHVKNLSGLWASTQEQTARQSVSLHQ